MEAEPSTPPNEAAAAAAAATAPVEAPKEPEKPKASPLEESVMAFAAANPKDGKDLMARIADMQKRLQEANKTVSKLENQSLDAELIRNSMEQLLKHLTPEASKQYLVDHKINDQLLSKKSGVRENALLRMVAACNSTFMSTVPMGQKAAARSAAVEEAAAPKRQRTAEPAAAAAPVALPKPASGAVSDADLLRQALAAQYNC